MAELKYTIASDKVTEYIEAYCYVHKNGETKDDPEWVAPDPNPNNEKAPQVAKYTDVQWVREHIKRGIKAQIVRGKNAMAKDGLAGQEAESLT